MEEDDNIEDMMLIGFGDRLNKASYVAVYLRTKRQIKGPEGETHIVRLLVGKAQVTPLSKAAGNLRKSTPRAEMRGGVLLARLVTAILNGIPYKPKEIFMALEAECTILALETQESSHDMVH